MPPVAGARLYQFHTAICIVQNQYCCPPSSCCVFCETFDARGAFVLQNKNQLLFTNFPDATTIHQATRLSSNHLHIALATLNTGRVRPHHTKTSTCSGVLLFTYSRKDSCYDISSKTSLHTKQTKHNVERFMIQSRGGVGGGGGVTLPLTSSLPVKPLVDQAPQPTPLRAGGRHDGTLGATVHERLDVHAVNLSRTRNTTPQPSSTKKRQSRRWAGCSGAWGFG